VQAVSPAPLDLFKGCTVTHTPGARIDVPVGRSRWPMNNHGIVKGVLTAMIVSGMALDE
jgi:hypothetical protein